MTDWFRSWHGAPTDNKWLVIGRRAGVAPGIVSAIVWALLDYASQAGDRGSAEGFDIETYAAFSGFDDAQIVAVINALQDKGLLDDQMRFVAWDKRQPKREDGSAERARNWRERNRTQANGAERPEERRGDTEGSVANATDGKPSLPAVLTVKDLLWREGVENLKTCGLSDTAARSNIGKFLRETRENHSAVLDATQRARDQGTRDPIAFMTGILELKKHGTPRKSDLAGAFDRLEERLGTG